ncbi:MAG: tRNA dihydrouridine(20/20a) synthase DusA [Chromatiales bacterium]|nr:tRNA dihydrouridine(20/20a) synthase DusA [Chromatiales bacterium]
MTAPHEPNQTPTSESTAGRPRVSVAPMMDWTDRDCRYFLRLLAPGALLYTEMVTAIAIVRGDRGRLLGFSPAEQPLVLQLGGSDPELLAEASAIAAGFGYRALNLNVGCPSSRVVEGAFGACLMKDPPRVADCVRAMLSAGLPVSVKTRIGVDDHDSYDALAAFIDQVSAAGCRHFIVHARKAWLSGLSPHENRTIPPLRYDVVYRLRDDFPALRLEINGGIGSVDDVAGHLGRVDGVMLGRKAYQDPWFLVELAQAGLCGPVSALDRAGVVLAMADYAAVRCAEGAPLRQLTRHMLGLYRGQRGGRAWRRFLTERAAVPGAGPEVLQESLALVGRRVPDAQAA